MDKMNATKHKKLDLFRETMLDIASFLVDYLPLANAHMTDFIVSDWWNKLVPKSIREDLMSMSSDEITLFPSGKLHPFECNLSTEKYCRHEHFVLYGDPAEVLSKADQPKIDPTRVPNWLHNTAAEFIKACQLRSLNNISLTTDLESVLDCQKDVVFIREFMSIKKQHEVEVMTELCASLARQHSLGYMVDLGSGKGYLSTHLVLRHGLRVLGIDSSCSNTEGATGRAQRLSKRWNGLVTRFQKQQSSTTTEVCSDNQDKTDCLATGRFVAITQFVDKQTDIQRLLWDNLIEPCDECHSNIDTSPSDEYDTVSNYPVSTMTTEILGEPPASSSNSPVERPQTTSTGSQVVGESSASCRYSDVDYMLGGLHACGDLSSTTLRLYIDRPSAHVLCNVGCCYHHLTEAFVKSNFDKCDVSDPPGFPLSEALIQRGCQLGRNARMLANQAPERIADNGKSPSISLYWRALLQVILYDITGEVRDDWCVGRIAAKCENFTQYLNKALTKLGYQQHLASISVSDYEQRYSVYQHYIQCFVQLKTALAPCIEALILLDRVCFLLQQECVRDVHLVPAFNPIVSPRCYAIIATKT